MADLKKAPRPARQRKAPAAPAQAQTQMAETTEEIDLKQAFCLEETPKEKLNPLSRLLFDANLCLNSYLEALKAAAGGNSGKPQAQFENANAKGVGAT